MCSCIYWNSELEICTLNLDSECTIGCENYEEEKEE